MEAYLEKESQQDFAIVELFHLLFERILPLSLFPEHVFQPNKRGVVGKKLVYDRDVLIGLTLNVPFNERETLRAHASAINVLKSTSHRLIDSGIFAVKSSIVKPMLTPANEYERFQYCLCAIDPRSSDRERDDIDDWSKTRSFNVRTAAYRLSKCHGVMAIDCFMGAFSLKNEASRLPRWMEFTQFGAGKRARRD